MTNKIYCEFHNNEKRQWEVTVEGRVWPCYNFANAWDVSSDDNPIDNKLLFQDDNLREIYENDSEWNSLHKHTLSEIESHTYYWTKIWYPGWESDNPHPLCKTYCTIKGED